jgi:outer membrane immunogenic protein
MYVPTVVPVYNWGGINGGYAFGKSDWTGAAVSSGDFDTSGFIVGGALGFNYQIGALVLGAETDLDYTGIKGTAPSTFCVSCQTSNSWLGTTRARVGFAADRVLFYGTGGAAYGNVQAAPHGVSNSSTQAGWTGGVGVETAFAEKARIE